MAIKTPKLNKTQYWTYFLSYLYISGLIAYWIPLIVYSSLPEVFNFTVSNLLKHNFVLFLIINIIGVLLLIPFRKSQYYLLISVLSLTTIAFLYSTIIPTDFGTLQGNLLSKEKNLDIRNDLLLLEAFLILSIPLFINWIYKQKKSSFILYALIILNVFLPIQSLYLSISAGSFLEKENTNSNSEKKISSPEIQFSKDRENVVFFVIDGAQGWYMNQILLDDTTLVRKYDGFIWYPNTLSISNYTYSSMPALMCGEEYNIANMNKDENHTIIEKITLATKTFQNKIKENNYHFTSSLIKYAKIDTDSFDTYIPSWHKEWPKILGLKTPKEIWYSRLSENAVFNCMPLFVKPKVYNNRNWIIKGNFDKSSSELNKYHFLELLPKISNTKSDNKNFIFIHSMFTHAPWEVITEEGKLIREAHPYDNQLWFTKLFAKWIDWMKKNEVYDNTKILLLSDHGPSWWHYKGEKNTNWFPIKNYDGNKITITPILRSNPLFMVKDFDNRGKIEENWQLMSNADAHAIAFDESDPRKNDSLNNRTVQTFYTIWHKDLDQRIKYKNQYVFEVKNNVYDLKNWKSIK